MNNELNEFKQNLTKYASKWVGRIAIPLVVRAEELAKDKTLVYLINKWSELHSLHEKNIESMFERVTDSDLFEYWYDGDIDAAIASYSNDYNGRKEG